MGRPSKSWCRWIAVVSCVLVAGSALAQNAPPPKVDAPDIKVGDSWTFDTKDGVKNVKVSTSVLTVTAVGDGLIRIDSKRADNGEVTKLTRTGELNLVATEIASGKAAYDPFYPSFSFPLAAAKTWEKQNTYTRNYEADRKVTSKMNAKVLGWEKVTVPAGTFDALKIEVTSVYNGENLRGRWSGRSTDTIWYAPEAKHFVKWLFEDGGGNVNSRTANLYELVTHKLVQ